MILESPFAVNLPHLSTAILPHDFDGDLRQNARMEKNDIFWQKMGAYLSETGESDRAFSMRATGSPDTLRNSRRNNTIPGSTNLMKIATMMGIAIDDLVGADAKPLQSEVRLAEVPRGYRGGGPSQSLPVYGTASGGEIRFGDNGHSQAIEQTAFEPHQVIRYVNRPASLENVKDAYAVYIIGESMMDRFAPGDMAVIDPRKPPMIGDDVIVQLADDDGDINMILIKRLAKRSATFIELEQFNPRLRFKVDAARVARLHRVMTTGEVLGG